MRGERRRWGIGLKEDHVSFLLAASALVGEAHPVDDGLEKKVTCVFCSRRVFFVRASSSNLTIVFLAHLATQPYIHTRGQAGNPVLTPRQKEE